MSVHLVTGAFGFSGRYLARHLLRDGHEVRTLTRSVRRAHEFGERIVVHAMDFDDPDALRRAMDGVDVFYNTYWVRFSKRGFSQTRAVENSTRLFEAARAAGVGRIVHTSITRPARDSPYEYFRGKAAVERALLASGVPSTILRPAVLYGVEDVLLNNIAWFLRRFPIFGLPGLGRYRLQPMFVDDFAALAREEGSQQGNRCLDAVGPDDLSFAELVRLVAQRLGLRRLVLPVPSTLAFAASSLAGLLLGDVVLTREEIGALRDGLLQTGAPARGPTRIEEFLDRHGSGLGRRYAREVARRTNRTARYEEL